MKLSESTIMIIDDDEEIVAHATKILENMEVTVLSAYDVHSALKILREQSPHLIITDLGMTPFTGFDLLTQLKADKDFSKIPAVVLSATSDKDAVYKAISLGARDYIVKPLNTSYFIGKIRRVLKDHEFLKFDFVNGGIPIVNVSVPGNLLSRGDIGIRVESGVCFDSIKSLRLRSDRPELIDIDKVNFSIHGKGSRALRGLFSNELIAVPAEPEFLAIRRRLST